MADIMSTEAGMLLVSERMGLLSNTQVMRILLVLALRGPLTQTELVDICYTYQPWHVHRLVKMLVHEGLVIRVRRRMTSGSPHKKKNRTFYHYFCADEFLPVAILESVRLLRRRHAAIAEGAAQVERNLLSDKAVSTGDV